MRFNNNKIKKVFDNLTNKKQVEQFISGHFKNEEFDIIPFELELGTANTTETGFKSDQFEIDSFTSYMKVLTGLNNLLAKWEGAYNVYIDYAANEGLPDLEQYITKEYKIGRLIKAISTTDTLGQNLAPSPVDPTFQQIEIFETINVQLKEQLSNADLFKVFLIPAKNKWKWLYIPQGGYIEYFDTANNFIYAECSFQSVNTIYSTSGGAVEQFIQKSAAGEGYAFPKLENGEIILDEIRTRDLPVNSAQIEFSAGAALGAFYCYGRPTIQKTENGITQNIFNPKIKASRILLPYFLQTPIISPLNTKPSAETDYYVAKSANPTLAKYFSNFKELINAQMNTATFKKYEGNLELESEADLKTTNPLSNGAHLFVIWDNTWKINMAKNYAATANKLSESVIALNGAFTIPEILAHNAFILNEIETLPISAENNISFRVNDFPLIGGFLNSITLGIAPSWNDTETKIKAQDLILLVPTSMVDYGNKLMNGSANSIIPFELFKESENDVIENSGIAGMGTAVKILLTDQFTKNGTTYNTIQLGQKLENGTILKWDGTCKPVAPDANTAGYVIDLVVDKAISKTNKRLVFFSGAEQVFQSTYKTKSKYTGEIRDWTNATKLSKWNAGTTPLKYPEFIQQPTPPDISVADINWHGADTLDFSSVINAQVDNVMREANIGTKLNITALWMTTDTGPTLNQRNNKFNLGASLSFPDQNLKRTAIFDYSNITASFSQFAALYSKITINGRWYDIPKQEITTQILKSQIVEIQFYTDTIRLNTRIYRKIHTDTLDIVPFDYTVTHFLTIDALSQPGKIIFTLINKNRSLKISGNNEFTNSASSSLEAQKPFFKWVDYENVAPIRQQAATGLTTLHFEDSTPTNYIENIKFTAIN